MKLKRLLPFFLVCLALVLAVQLAWADSCPYCGQEYGDAAPGDESRVAALRANHEASCSARSSGGSGYGASSGGGTRWTKQDQWEYEQMLLAEQERQRQIAEQKRKERLKREAEERAENEAKKLEWEQKKTELSTMLKGASPSGTETDLKTAGGSTVFLTGRGIKSKLELKGDEIGNAPQTQIIKPGKISEASDSQPENMRRAFWLYQKAAQASSGQEAEFLIEQANEAAQGHALKVEVPDSPEISRITPEKLNEFKEVKTEIETARIEADILNRQKLGAEDKKNLYKRRTDDLENQLKTLREERAKAQPGKKEEKPVVTEEKPKEEKVKEEKNPEEDLLAQLMEAQKQMENADKALNQLESEKAKIEGRISTGEKKLGNVLKK
ncbi:MAG: hypothetical protein HZC17_07030 [Candidatus Omnitrophica bacterium]|nr:hypothetical protein [Candidatus Omnitrophota bacterium]